MSSSPTLSGIQKHLNIIKDRIENMASKIQEFAAKQTEFNSRLETAIEGVTADVTELKETIEQLQSTSGEINAEDQALLDSLSEKAEAAVTKLEALDKLTETTPKPPSE
jgi:ABC-type transporter Mla subunit MlaD